MDDQQWESQHQSWGEYFDIVSEKDMVWSPHTKEYVDAPPQLTFEELSPPQQRAAEYLAKLDMVDP